MRRPAQIPINQFQLAILLNEKEKEDYKYLLEKGVYCGKCGDIAKGGVVVEQMFLTDLNDIYVLGACKICNGRVARTMEFGEDKVFYEKATEFRKAIK